MKAPDLPGKVAIVTGAGHGAGRAVAAALAAAGARVAVNDINPDRAYRVAAELAESGGAARGIMADVSNRFQCVHLIETTRAEWGRIDLLVNCAAIAPSAPVLKMDEWELMRVLDVNLKGVFFMCQLVGRVMADRHRIDGARGLMINLAGAEPEGVGQAAYAITQAALPAFGRACAREYGPLGIDVHTLSAAALPEETAALVMGLVDSGQ
ncbi:MAG: SDR family NAD(P)-dependent oxidoreductase [Anaerolineales bacterium]|nr:SDR family NAD(P)-dependent oxidoreductase [Anaerolineales bacterium]